MDKVSELANADSASLSEKEHNVPVAMCGVLSGIQRKRNREGRPWAVATLEVRVDRMGEAAADPMLLATDLAEILVRKGVAQQKAVFGAVEANAPGPVGRSGCDVGGESDIGTQVDMGAVQGLGG